MTHSATLAPQFRHQEIAASRPSISRIARNAETDRAYLEVDGKPFLYNSVQSWYPPERDYTVYIRKASEAGFRIFTFWLIWRNLEPMAGRYDFTELARLIAAAEELDMRLDIVWGGTNFCGHLDPRFAPDWLLNNPEFHLPGPDGKSLRVDGYDMGPCLVANAASRSLLAHEKKTLGALTDFLAERDLTHRVVLFQVLNEVDLPGTPEKPGCIQIPLWSMQDKNQLLSYCNELGRVIKESRYPVATRMNLSVLCKRHDPEVEALPYIDFHGLDVYTDRIGFVRDSLDDRQHFIFPHIAENAAYENCTSLVVATLAAGSAYNIYKLDFCTVWKKPGVYTENWVETDLTRRIRSLNLGLNDLAPLLCTTALESFREFNNAAEKPLPQHSEEWSIGNRKIRFTTQSGAVGLAISVPGGCYFVADAEVEIAEDSRSVRHEYGRMDKSGRWIPGALPAPLNGSLSYTPGRCLFLHL